MIWQADCFYSRIGIVLRLLQRRYHDSESALWRVLPCEPLRFIRRLLFVIGITAHGLHGAEHLAEWLKDFANQH